MSPPRSGTVLRVFAALLASLVIGAVGRVGQAQAATYIVGNTGDPTGACALTATTCSLRQLINDENGLNPAPNPADTIVVPSGIYSLTQGQLLVRQSLTIAGAGAETTQIDQEDTQATARVFEIMGNAKINPDPTVVISGVAMAFGKADSTNGSQGGDVQNQANLTLSEDLIEDGTASGTGGGVSNDGGTLTISHSLVWQNSSATVIGATVTGGIAGGVENYGDTTVGAGTLSIDNSTIADNTAAELGGGVVNRCAGINSACSSTAGVKATTTIRDSTIADNNGGSGGVTGGGLLASQGTISIGSSIVASNTVTNPTTGGQTPSNCGAGPAGVPNPGVLNSLGYNLETATDCGFTSTGDIQSTNPQFFNGGGLAFNGGNTETFALSMTSPAVDAIPKSVTGCSGTDQRDIPRPQGSRCDIGAYELFEPVEGSQFTTVLGRIGATSATIDWADGSRLTSATVDSLGNVIGTHTYAEEGNYSGLIDWTNSDGAAQTTPFDLKVQDAALTASAVNFTAVAGEQFSGPVATFTDANPNAPVSDYTATIVWGDGNQSTGTVTAGPSGGFVVSGTHTYGKTGSYQTTVSIADVGGSTAVVLGTATVDPPAPTVTQVSASAGPTAGGTAVTITGTNFAGATGVSFGSTAASSFTVNSSTSITATAPAESAGTIDITVTTAGGTSATSTADQYTYVSAPTLTLVGPSSGPLGGGNSVALTGTGFTNATAVLFGSTAASSFTINSATSITATAPAESAGTVDITVTNPGGISATGSADQYTYFAAPTVTSINPTAGPTAGGNSVTITGTNFTGATAVSFGKLTATSFTINSATSISAIAPAEGAGTVKIAVSTPGGTSASTSADQYTYTAAPTVTNVSPSAGPTGGGTSITITGTNLTGATAVSFGSTPATSFSVTSSTQISATAPAGAGVVDVTVTTPGGTSATSAADRYGYGGCTDEFSPQSGDDWGTAANWSEGTVPTSSDVACWPVGTDVTVSSSDSSATAMSVEGGDLTITGGSLSLAGTAGSTLVDLTETGGGLNGPGALALSGNFSWTGGQISSSQAVAITQAAGKTFSITGTNQEYLEGGSISTQSPVTISDTSLIATNSPTLTTTSTVTFGPGSYQANGGASLTISAAGFDTTGATTIPNYALSLTGNASSLGGSLTTPVFNSAANTTLTVGATIELSVGQGTVQGTITGQGTYNQGSGTTTFPGAATLSTGTVIVGSGLLSTSSEATFAAGATTVAGGTLDLADAATTGSYTESLGGLNGPGSLALTGAFSWTGGAISSGQAIAITQAAGQTFSITGTNQAYLEGGSISTQSPVTITNTNFIATNSPTLTTTSTVTFGPGSYQPNGGVSLAITGAGVVTTGATTLNNYSVDVDGTTSSLGGSLTVPSLSSTSGSSITVPSGIDLSAAGGTINGTITGTGTYTQTNGTSTIASGGTLSTRAVTVAGGTLTVNSGAGYAAGGATTMSGGTLNIGPASASTGSLTETAGALNGPGFAGTVGQLLLDWRRDLLESGDRDHTARRADLLDHRHQPDLPGRRVDQHSEPSHDQRHQLHRHQLTHPHHHQHSHLRPGQLPGQRRREPDDQRGRIRHQRQHDSSPTTRWCRRAERPRFPAG